MRQRFGDIIGQARRSRKITLKELSGAVGLGSSVISEVEHGHRLPPADVSVVERLAKFLGLDCDILLECSRLERKLGKDSIEKRLLQVNPDLALGFAREIEHTNDAELVRLFEEMVVSMKRKRGEHANG